MRRRVFPEFPCAKKSESFLSSNTRTMERDAGSIEQGMTQKRANLMQESVNLMEPASTTRCCMQRE